MDDPAPMNGDTWMEFLGPSGAPHAATCCGLCGNSGVVDTRGKIRDPRGNDCGVRACCICPNGRAIKHQLNGTLPSEGEPS